MVGAGGVGVHPGLVCPHPVHTWALLQLQGLSDDVSPGAVTTLLQGLPDVQTHPPGHNLRAPDNREGDDDTVTMLLSSPTSLGWRVLSPGAPLAAGITDHLITLLMTNNVS